MGVEVPFTFRFRRPPGHGDDRAGRAGQPGGQAELAQPVQRATAADDRGGVCHHEPPEVTWLLPEVEDGVDPALRPELELELDPVEADPELAEPDEVDPVELDPELAVLEPLVEEALAVCVDSGRTKANAPAAATLATVTAAVAVLTLRRPRVLAAIA